ncbi:MAG: hypothetical protein ABL877_06730 [Thiobacillus sp.]
MIKAASLAILLMVGGMLFWRYNVSLHKFDKNRDVLSPDMTFFFDCQGKDRAVLEGDITKFLMSEGFRVLNERQIERAHGFNIFDIHISGFDVKRGIIEFMSFPPAAGSYSVRFISPPPTQHSAQIEEAILTFARNNLECEIRQRSGGENGIEVTNFYNSEVKRIEGLFRELAKMNQGSENRVRHDIKRVARWK